MKVYRFLKRVFPALFLSAISIAGLTVAMLGEVIGGHSIVIREQTILAASVQPEAEKKVPYTIVIDAGHGGEDGGTQSAQGLFEKDVNLAIAEMLNDMLRAAGIPTVMTRTEDILLYDRNVDYHGRKKVLDLAARRKIAESTENALFISIHMNAFPQTQYHGLQVFYSPHQIESKELADLIQQTTKEVLQPDNERKTKKATSSIYLLDRLTCPAVLVECGFLSNPTEAEQLSHDEYRQQVAMVLFSAIMRQISDKAS